MHYAENKNIPGLLLLIDFEKAFDTVSWKFIEHVLKNFNFGKDIQKWVHLFQNNIFSVVNQGGNISENVNIHRGCRQGDQISLYIFILCVEVLANHIRNNKNIKGMSISNNEHINLSQFADDTTVILDGNEHSLSSALETISVFGTYSGLKINIDISSVDWIQEIFK